MARMAREIPTKRILEYRAMGLSRNLIAKTQKVGRSSVSVVFNRANDLGLTDQEVEGLSESEVYQTLFLERDQSETLYDVPEYTYCLRHSNVTTASERLIPPKLHTMLPLELDQMYPLNPLLEDYFFFFFDFFNLISAIKY